MMMSISCIQWFSFILVEFKSTKNQLVENQREPFSDTDRLKQCPSSEQID